MKIGVYVRVSSREQKEKEGIKVQRKLGIEWCENNGYGYEVYEDVVSGVVEVRERKGFGRLFKDIEKGIVDGIWVYDWDRIFREQFVGVMFRDVIESNRVRLFVNGVEKDISSDVGSIEFGMYNVMSEYWKRKLVGVMRDGKYEKWKKGEGFGGRVGIGFKRVDNKVVVDEDKKDIVLDIYKFFLRKDVESFEKVRKMIVTKYGKVKGVGSSNRVRSILLDEKYKGVYSLKDRYGDEYNFEFGRIISDEVFDEVKKKIDYITGLRSVNSVDNYLLKGKIRCVDCKERMWVRGGGSKNYGRGSGVYRYYNCNNEYRKNRISKNLGDISLIKDCDSVKKGNNKVSVKKLEIVVWDSLFYVLENSKVIKEEYRRRYDKNLGLKDNNLNKLKYYEKELVNWNKKKDDFLEKYVDGDFSKEDLDSWRKNKYDFNVERIKKRIKDLKGELLKLESGDKIDGFISLMKEDLRRRRSNKRFEFRRRMINKYVDCVYVGRRLDESRIFDVFIKFGFDDESMNDVSFDYDKNFNVYIVKDVTSKV